MSKTNQSNHQEGTGTGTWCERKILAECLFDLSDNEDSDNSLDGDCCLKDLANTQEQKQAKQMEMASVDKEKIHKKKREIIYHKKSALTKQTNPSGHKYFLQKKRSAKYVSDT